VAVYDVELLSLPPHVPSVRVATLLGVSEADAEELYAELPAVVAHRIDESDAEALFHELVDLGAKVGLRPVVGAPSRRPGSVRPIPLGDAEATASALPAASSTADDPQPPTATDIPAAPAVPSAVPGAVEPIDLGDFVLPAFGDELDLEGPSVGGSWDPGPGSIEPLDIGDAASGPPPGAAVMPLAASLSAPLPSIAPSAPVDPGWTVPEGSFATDILWAYLYPLRPKVLGVSVAAAIPILLLSLPSGSLFGVGLYTAFMFTLFKVAVTGLFAFWLMRHAYLGREGALPWSSDISHAENPSEKGIRLMLIFLPMIVVALFGATPWRELFAVVWVLYLPAAFILAFFGSGWLGGMNVVGGVRMILRVPLAYLALFAASLPLILVALVAFFLVSGGSTVALYARSWLVYLITGGLAVIYMLAVAALARLLGRFMLRYEDDIGLS